MPNNQEKNSLDRVIARAMEPYYKYVNSRSLGPLRLHSTSAIDTVLARFPPEKTLRAVDDDDESGRRPIPVDMTPTIAEIRAARVELAILKHAFSEYMKSVGVSGNKDAE